MPIIAILILSSLCATSGTLLLKLGAHEKVGLLAFINFPIFFGLSLYALGSFFWIYALSRAPVSTVYPFTALTFVLVIIGAFFLFNDRPNLTQWIGIGFILLGLASVIKGA